MNAADLKPCPFCGEHLELKAEGALHHYEHPDNGCLLKDVDFHFAFDVSRTRRHQREFFQS